MTPKGSSTNGRNDSERWTDLGNFVRKLVTPLRNAWPDNGTDHATEILASSLSGSVWQRHAAAAYGILATCFLPGALSASSNSASLTIRRKAYTKRAGSSTKHWISVCYLFRTFRNLNIATLKLAT